MATAINLNNRFNFPLVNVNGTADVWVKARWADPWTRRPDLYPVQSVWSVAPNVSTATLEYRYGRILVPGDSKFSTLAPITSRGYFVCIRWRDQAGLPIDWIGYAETPVTRDRVQARDGLPQSGKQTIPCFGLLRALEQTIIDTSVYADPEDEENAKRSGGTGSVFNQGLRGNRTAQKRRINGEGQAAYVFADPNDPTAKFWSTRDIVEHLAAFHLPTPESVPSEGGIPWRITNLAVLPSWDRPSLDSDLRSVASILSQLITPSKMINYGIGAQITGDIAPTVDTLNINPFSLLASPLSLVSGTLPANTRQFDLTWTADPLTTVVIDEDSTGVVDQVIVQGPREIAVTSLHAHPTAQSPYEKGWTAEDETNYSNGAIAWAGWVDATIDEKRAANERYRTSELRDVYSLYKFKANWNGEIGGEPLFFPNEDDSTCVPFLQGLEVLDELPLYKEVDYSGDPASVDESAGIRHQQPILSLRKRTNGVLQNERFYVDPKGRLTLPPELLVGSPWTLDYEIDDYLNIRLIVKDAPQHAIAGKDFVGNVGDMVNEIVFGDVFHEGWNLTVAIRGDRRPRFRIPADVSNLDVVRRKIVTLDDDSLASIYITKGAIVGWTNTSPNPVISPGGLLRDPTPILQSICQMLAKQHAQPRRKATIRTGRRLPMFQLGDLINTVETASGPVEAIISEIRIDAPMGEGNTPPPSPSQTIVASPYRADVLGLLRRDPVPLSPTKRRKAQPREIKPRSERRTIVPRAQRLARRRAT